MVVLVVVLAAGLAGVATGAGVVVVVTGLAGAAAAGVGDTVVVG